MIDLYQFPWSPFCLVQSRVLEFGRIPFRRIAVSPGGDRSSVWRVTRQRYYQVPVIRHGRQVVFETGAETQVIAKYLDSRFGLGLFPARWEGVQDVIWRHLENEVEDATFRLNDAQWRDFVPARERCAYLRHKERRFGKGCLDEWLARRDHWLAELERRLVPYEQMLATRPYLLDERPVFVDFCLLGLLDNFLFSGRYRLPASLPRLGDWRGRLVRQRADRQPSTA